jgi:YHS domain-containing protein
MGTKKEKIMSDRTKHVARAAVVVGIFFAMLLAVQGCGKEEPAAQPPSTSTAVESTTTAAQTAPETAEANATTVTVAAEQTTCPVMDGRPINKDLFVEYKGKKVYFCCKGCEQTFLADPEKYVAKLPQFQE